MRQALRAKAIPQGQTSTVHSYPSPVGGWNARDALAQMKETDAVVLDNWHPNTSYCEIRGGYIDHATGMTGNGKTLAVYNAMTGTNTMFCTTVSGTYNVTSSGAVGASVAARTNGKHQWVMFGDGSSNWLIMCNGVDKPLYYDGTAWTAVDASTTPALTGVTSSNLISVNVFKGRLFFIENNTLYFWYLAAGVAGGALTKFDLAGEFQRGGYLMAMATWTRDAGNGQDDVAAFISSEGEVAVYQGNNPSVAANWAKIGSYFIGRPLGRRCVRQFGGDVVILTQNGTFPLSAALQSAAIDYKMALSFKIEKAFTDSARTYGSTFGWSATVYPAQSALIVNIPIVEGGTHYQYVMNTITKAWCRFIGWDAEDFVVMGGELYFTTGTKTCKAWTGFVDGTSDIVAYGKQAFSYFGSNVIKKFKMYRPVLSVNGNLSFLTDIDVDFKDTTINGVATYSVTSGALWDSANWDEGLWAADLEIARQWTSPDEWQGSCASGKLKVATNSLTVQWMANDIIYEKGGIFG